ncbi:MAG: hypothetical protein GQ570_01855 [Helicobacteraceae bacterium]|nr:hypothetical protein [Helicobacteraceae bacterium]
MNAVYGSREIVRNPSLLRIDANESFIVEDKKAHKTLGVYLGVELANEFFKYTQKQKLLSSARKIKDSASEEVALLNGTDEDGI